MWLNCSSSVEITLLLLLLVVDILLQHRALFQCQVSFSPMICQLNGCPHIFVVLFLIPFFLKLIVACRLSVIYVREDNNSNVWAVISRLIWTIWTSLSPVPRKAVKFNHPLTRWEPSKSFYEIFTDMQDNTPVFWCVVGKTAINNMLKFHDNI